MLGRTIITSRIVVSDRWSPSINLSALATSIHTIVFEKEDMAWRKKILIQ
jgi:hypothetical protein